MSLLLDARKKSQQALSASGEEGFSAGRELSLEPPSGAAAQSASPSASLPAADPFGDNTARKAGQNLFKAKSSVPSNAFASINRKVLIALGLVVIFLVAGAGYVWYIISPDNSQPVRAIPLPPPHIEPPPTTAQSHTNLVPEITSPQRDSTVTPIAKSAKSSRTRKTDSQANSPLPPAPQNNSVHIIEQRQDEPIDALLHNAYLAYRSGKLEQAQQQYREALNLDSSNTDALLGLAVIAQRHGMDSMAAHYYAKVMALDPRNAVANAGMSALTTDDNRESRLKTLLNEQQDSASLHFALGNYYAGLARWGEAQSAYFDAYKLEPDNAELAFNLASSLDHLGQKKLAAQYYERALQLDAGNQAAFDHAKILTRIKALTGIAGSRP
jgi:tetratricopeptide (TPR) repeat protein